jgi:poly[(R)-3-hydroxyalkanoate] polymerase subunit PhaC
VTSTPPPVDPQEYLENLMRAGQDAMKQFDDALASVAGVGTKESLSSGRLLFPFALIADPSESILSSDGNSGTLYFFRHSPAARIRVLRWRGGDKRFKDDAWQEMPYYDLQKP